MAESRYISWPLKLNFLWGPQRRAAIGLASAAHHPVRLTRFVGTAGLVTKKERDDDKPTYSHSAAGSVSLMRGRVDGAHWRKIAPIFVVTRPRGLKVEGHLLDQHPLAIQGQVGTAPYAATITFAFEPRDVVLGFRELIWLVFEVGNFEREYSVANVSLTGFYLEAEGFIHDRENAEQDAAVERGH